MNLKLSFYFNFIIFLTVLTRIIYGSDFDVVSTTAKPSQKNKEDVALNLCLALVENKLQAIEYLSELHQKQLQDIENKILVKFEEKEKLYREELLKNQKEMESKIEEILLIQKKLDKIENGNSKQLREVENNIITKIDANKNSCEKKYQDIESKQEEILKIQKTFEKIENEKCSSKQLQEVEYKIITKINGIESSCEKKHQEDILQNQKQLQLQAKMLNKLNPAENCQKVLQIDNVTSVYFIRPKKSSESFKVLCDFTTRGGGWIYILKRFDGSQDFFLGWEDYKNGFGSLDGEFWLGLKYIHELTSNSFDGAELLIELVDWNDVTKYALYDNFKVEGESSSYYLTNVGSYVGDAGDSFPKASLWYFKTKDKDFGSRCPKDCEGGWWYETDGKPCWTSHLTGRYYTGQKANNSDEKGMSWLSITGRYRTLKEARMLIRPKTK